MYIINLKKYPLPQANTSKVLFICSPFSPYFPLYQTSYPPSNFKNYIPIPENGKYIYVISIFVNAVTAI